MERKKIELPPCGMFIGCPVYLEKADYVFQHVGEFYTSWTSEDHDLLWYLDAFIRENQGNLLIVWDGGVTQRCLKAAAEWCALDELQVAVPEPDWEHCTMLTPDDWPELRKYGERFGAGYARFVRAAGERGIFSYGIYSEAAPRYVREMARNPFCLGYNTGEKFSFDLGNEADGVLRERKTVYDPNCCDLASFAEAFGNSVRRFISEKRAEGWHRFLITAASFHLDIEVAAAGKDVIPHLEYFPFGDINFASSLCRGIYRQFDLPLWGAYLAHEHYSFLPYASPLKFPSLDMAFKMVYMGGAKLAVLESGNFYQQTDHVQDTLMHDTPKFPNPGTKNNDPHLYAHLVPEARKHYHNLNYSSEICRKYRESLADFYEYVQENGTPQGQVESRVAGVKGRFDLASSQFSPNMALAGAAHMVEKNPLWLEGTPERSWELYRQVFHPRLDNLGKYVNPFFSGTPFGMTDIVSLCTLPEKHVLDRYKCLLFTGWNSATEEQYNLLLDYVAGGGTVFLGIAHLTKLTDRNYLNYTVNDLVRGGDFSELCGVRIKGKGAQYYWLLAAENNSLGFAKYQHFGQCHTHLGELEIVDDIEPVLVHDESFAPGLFLHRYGRGRVFFLNAWEYPGAFVRHDGPSAERHSGGIICEVYRRLAFEARGTCFITDDGMFPGENCDYIAFSHFPDDGTICLLNTDFLKSHTFMLHIENRCEKITLAPAEFRKIGRT